jgi:hypothetical protein
VGGHDNRWRIAWIPLAIALALAGCKKKRHEDAIYAQPGDAYPIPVVDARPIDAAIDAPSEHDQRVERTQAYIELLTLDFWIYEVLDSFPGAPTSGTFVAINFDWQVVDLAAPDAVRSVLDHIAALARAPHTAADDAVRAYTDALVPALPALLDLREYYKARRFIDDEFDRARREAPDLERLRNTLDKLRVPMRSAVLNAWQELSSDVPDSPRAIVTTAWRKCVAVADVLMKSAKRPEVEAAMSACRRSVPSVSALPGTSGGAFADTVRGAAIQLGDGVANSLMARDLPTALDKFTKAYLALWPTLPNTPAEHAVP